MIGVITPMYNAEKSIVRALDSVQKQNCSHTIHHYIYNDGSTDKSRDMIKEYYQENNERAIDLINNCFHCLGQSVARNVLIKQAIRDNCEYIAFLDADDEWYPDHIKKSIENLKYCDISYSIPQLTDGSQDVIAFGIPVPKIFIGKHLENNNFIWISGVVATTDCFKSFYFDSTLDSIEDWDMWYRLYKFGYSFKCTDTTSFKYFVANDTGASKSGKKLELLREKHGFKMKSLNLHLACGDDYQSGYINVDLYPRDPSKVDAEFDVSTIPYEDNTVDTIRALHIIEHFSFNDGKKVLNEWYRVLKPGGKLIIETPDLLATCKRFVESSENFRITLYGHLFAYPDLPGQIHKFLFTETQLKCQLGWAGFKNMKRINPISNYVSENTVDIFLAMEAYK